MTLENSAWKTLSYVAFHLATPDCRYNTVTESLLHAPVPSYTLLPCKHHAPILAVREHYCNQQLDIDYDQESDYDQEYKSSAGFCIDIF